MSDGLKDDNRKVLEDTYLMFESLFFLLLKKKNNDKNKNDVKKSSLFILEANTDKKIIYLSI